MIGNYCSQMTVEFFRAVAHNAGITLHIRQMSGSNGHHIIEGAFKAFARALRMAISCSGTNEIPSSKGLL